MNTEVITSLATRLKGNLIAPGHPDYDDVRKVWNGTIDKKPGAIARCANVEDVIAAVNFAREEGLAISVRGGGHHVAGGALNDGGLVVDLSLMRDVSYDASTQKARAQGGALLVDVDTATLEHGRAVPMGVFGETGIAGLTLAGGYGWQSRNSGLSCDSLISAEIVTANGERLQASASENADLFWALRGGGTNLGVVTSFEYSTQPIPPEVLFTFLAYPLAEASQVLRRLREYTASAPNALGLIAVIWTFPASEPFPEPVWNQQFIGIAGPYFGPIEEAQRVTQPLREMGTLLFDGSEAMPFGAVQTFFDEDYPVGRRYYWRSSYLRELSDDAIAALVELGGRRPSPLTSLDIWILGGAIGDIGPNDTPIAHRQAPFMIGIESNWDDAAQDGVNIAWAREVFATLEPFSTGGSYLNFEDTSDQKRVAAVYGANYQRLTDIKRKYDPDNLFG